MRAWHICGSAATKSNSMCILVKPSSPHSNPKCTTHNRCRILKRSAFPRPTTRGAPPYLLLFVGGECQPSVGLGPHTTRGWTCQKRTCWSIHATFGALVSWKLQRAHLHGTCPATALPPLCDIPSGCCIFTRPWTVTRSSLLLSVGRCGRCSCWCRFHVRGAQ